MVLFANITNAQELKLKEFRADITDISAAKFKVKDLSGNPCALIKLGIVLQNLTFEGDIVKSEYKDGEWWIYLCEGSNYLTIKSTKYLPLRCEFDGVIGNTTYLMMVELPQLTNNQPTGEVDIGCNVKDVDIYIDGEKMSSRAPYRYKGGDGEHIIEVKAAGYNTERATFSIKLNRRSQIYIALKTAGSLNVNGVSYEMVTLPSGSFFMGSIKEDRRKTTFNNEKPVHEVALRSYKIGKTEVTQNLWFAVMGYNPSANQGDNLPVENITWDEVQTFIKKLNELTNNNYRLPTEAEWEYAARSCGKEDSENYAGRSNPNQTAHIGNSTTIVGSKQPNDIGIFDMSGNVSEWCADFIGRYPATKVVNPSGPSMGINKVIRGGAYNDDPWYMRNSARGYYKRTEAAPFIGFRLALDN